MFFNLLGSKLVLSVKLTLGIVVVSSGAYYIYENINSDSDLESTAGQESGERSPANIVSNSSLGNGHFSNDFSEQSPGVLSSSVAPRSSSVSSVNTSSVSGYTSGFSSNSSDIESGSDSYNDEPSYVEYNDEVESYISEEVGDANSTVEESVSSEEPTSVALEDEAEAKYESKDSDEYFGGGGSSSGKGLASVEEEEKKSNESDSSSGSSSSDDSSTPIQVTPTVSFDVATSQGSESQALWSVAVELSEASTEIVTVDYTVTGGTATDPADYTISGVGTLNFCSW